MTYHVYLGFDHSEKEAYQVAKYSLLKRATCPVAVHALKSQELKQSGLLTREHKEDSKGQMIDLTDGRPFSTAFTFSRFLVPELHRNNPDGTKSPLVMFADCDILVLEDIKYLFEEVERQKKITNGKYAVYCVHLDFQPQETKKMDGQAQSTYNRKCWSAVMIFDIDHPDNALLTPEVVNSQAGRDLMRFYWLSNENDVGVLPERWQFLPGYSEKFTQDIALLHWTSGGPWHKNYRRCRYADLWYTEYNEYLKSKVTSMTFDVESIIHD